MSILDQIDALSREMGTDLHHSMDRRGLTLAKVTNITDPDKFNRVKCLPVGSENTTDEKGRKTSEETDWCYVMTPAGGPEGGIFWFPQVDDLVVLAYLEGDPHRPLVIGGLWTTEVKPPYTIEEGKVQEYSFRTPSKTELLIHDEKDKHKATLTMPSGAVLIMDDENKILALQDKDKKNLVSIDWKGGNLSIKADNKIELSSGKSSVTLEKSGNISIEGGSNVTIKGNSKVEVSGANVELKGNSSVSVSGLKTEVKASTTLDLNGSAMATLKGGMVKIN